MCHRRSPHSSLFKFPSQKGSPAPPISKLEQVPPTPSQNQLGTAHTQLAFVPLHLSFHLVLSLPNRISSSPWTSYSFFGPQASAPFLSESASPRQLLSGEDNIQLIRALAFVTTSTSALETMPPFVTLPSPLHPPALDIQSSDWPFSVLQC